MKALLAALGAKDGDTRYVGGCVRRHPARPRRQRRRPGHPPHPAGKYARLGKARIKAPGDRNRPWHSHRRVAGKPVEVDHAAAATSHDGRRATIAYTDDWREDAARRDFTINALSADPVTRQVHVNFGGEEDLAAPPGPLIGGSLTESPRIILRILRFFRFHAASAPRKRQRGDWQLRRARQRPDGPLARAHRRRADQALTLPARSPPSG